MKQIIAIALAIFLQTFPASGIGQESDEERSILQEMAAYTLAQQGNDSDAVIDKIGSYLRKTGTYGIYHSEDAKKTHDFILEKIMEKNYAPYYEDIIKKTTEDFINKVTGDSYPRTLAFQTIEQIPAPPAIMVMGNFLSDSRNPWADVPPDDGGAYFIPSDQYAAVCLTRGKLCSKPKMSDSGCPFKEDRDAWREWFQQVKSGKRTFSFEGQNVCYRFLPDGSYETLPLSKSIGEDKPIQSRRLPKMDTRKVQAPPTPSVTVHQASPFPWSTIAWLVGGFGLLTIGGGFWWARRNLK